MRLDDVADFVKYALPRFLSGQDIGCGFRPGVHWCLPVHDERNGDLQDAGAVKAIIEALAVEG